MISVQQGNDVVPIVPQASRRHALLASKGIFVEYHSNEVLSFPERKLLQHNLFLYTGPAVQGDIQSPGFSGTRWFRPGTLWIMPEGSWHQVSFYGKTSGIALAFSPKTFASLLESADCNGPREVIESLSVSPPKVEHLMRALGYESSQPGTRDHFGVECIATALALAATETVVPKLQRQGPRLTPRQLRVVQAYIEANLQQAVTLGDLAAAAGLSSFHFLRAFKQSMGVTPRRYVLDRRIEAATVLLKDSRLSVAEIGVRVGFDHAPHFTRAFGRMLGVSPQRFRGESQK